MSNNACVPNEISIDNVKYVRADSVKTPPNPGKRAVMVLDRGWIMAGDVEYRDGRVYLTRVVHVRRWDGVGFDGMVKDPSNIKVKQYLFPLPDCDFPASTELFKVPVSDSWGIF